MSIPDVWSATLPLADYGRVAWETRSRFAESPLWFSDPIDWAADR